jgi:hypothetical protein
LSGAVGNSTFTIANTVARTYTFPNYNLIVAGSATALTAARVPFAGTAGILTDDADFTFATDTLTVTKIAATTFSAGFTMADAQNVVLNGTTGTKIGTATTQKLGFWNKAPIVQPTALTAQLTSITHTAPGTPDYAVQDLTNSGGFGFVTKDEGNTVLSVILNLQTRVQELENKLSAAAGGSGLIA